MTQNQVLNSVQVRPDYPYSKTIKQLQAKRKKLLEKLERTESSKISA